MKTQKSCSLEKVHKTLMIKLPSGNTKGGSIQSTVDLLFDWFGLFCFANNNKSCHTADSKPVKQEVNGKVILPALVFPATLHVEVHANRDYTNCDLWPSENHRSHKIQCLRVLFVLQVFLSLFCLFCSWLRLTDNYQGLLLLNFHNIHK